jgi:tRNA(Ile)-lysidine synthase
MSADSRPPLPSGIALPGSDVSEVVRQFAIRNDIATGTLVIGVSGGADSTALLVALHELCEESRLSLVVAHLDHGWRVDSAEDAAHVQRLAERFRLPVVVRSLVPGSNPQTEAAARQVRRDFFTDVARKSGARSVALGHTCDDQVETVLHRLLRGTGLRGLGGMSEVSPLSDGIALVRPLLSVSRRDLETWLDHRGVVWRTDTTNSDTRWTRNRIRHTLLPLLRTQFNPEVDQAILRLVAQTREVADWLAASAHDLLDSALLEESALAVRLSVAVLRRHSPVVIREMFRELWRLQCWPEAAMSAEHWQALADAISADTDAAAARTLPGRVQLERQGMILRLTVGTTVASASESPETPQRDSASSSADC